MAEPTTPAPRRARLRVTELVTEHGITRQDLAQVMMPDTELGRPRQGTRRPISIERKRDLIGSWDRGDKQTGFRFEHLLRMADHFEEYDVRNLITYEPRPTRTNQEEGD